MADAAQPTAEPSTGPPPTPSGRELGSDLLSVVARLNRLASQRIRLPVPWAQARLLSTIDDHGEARISDLASLDHCSQPTMTTQVRRLEDAELVSRTTDPGDGRAVLIQITDKGRKVLADARADRAAAINPWLDRLEPADRDTLADAVVVIRRLLADVAAHPNT
ncbi:MAG: MarR family transcriptional regulator [Actinobacteria bacterium]|nr:MarR family transcriptional regulator [Actinomycetota bacterium]